MAAASNDKAASVRGLRRIAPPRFIFFAIGSIALSAVAATRVGWQHGTLIGFDIAAALFLISLIPLLRNGESDDMRRHAAQNDANRLLLLILTAGVTIVLLIAIALELAAKGGPPPEMIALIVLTLILSWLFSNTVYALHYAHIYYLKDDDAHGDRAGIDFPDTPEPDYWDFVYFAYTLGMTFQTSDCDIASRHIRRVVTFHCLIAFVFNIGVVAFTINVLGSAGGK
jgi:uncharacterized membrane protein